MHVMHGRSRVAIDPTYIPTMHEARRFFTDQSGRGPICATFVLGNRKT